MKQYSLYIFLLFFLSVQPAVGADFSSSAGGRSSAPEGETLRYKGISLTVDSCVVTDTAMVWASIDELQNYVAKTKKVSRRHWLMLAENYFLLGKYAEATAIYAEQIGDGLSHLRLGEMIYLSHDANADYNKALYHYNQGMSISSALVDEYNQAVKNASQMLPLYLYNIGDATNACKYHRAFTKESEAATDRWMCQLYRSENKMDKAIQFAKMAVSAEPSDSCNYELVADCYFSLADHVNAFPYWSKAAELGSARGHIRLGQSYAKAWGGQANDSLAIVHLEEGLKTLRWKWAQKMLAGLYQKGDASNPNFNIGRAHYWLSQCAAAGDWGAKAKLAESLAYWGRQQSDPAERATMLSQANTMALEVVQHIPTDRSAWMVLGMYLGDSLLADSVPNLQAIKEKRRYLATSSQRDMQICRMLADAGYVDEMIQLAKGYTTGTYEYVDFLSRHTVAIDTNYVAAFNYWQQALNAKPDDVECITAVAEAYTFGRGVGIDIDRAKRIWESHGMYNYASTYFYPWHTWKIQQGDIEEVIYMFNFYSPTRLNMSVEESLHWLKNAAVNGNNIQRTTALFLLGGVYEKGQLLPPDYEQAVAYYRQSAMLNSANANRRLGEIYKLGACGVNRNYEMAALYFQRCHQITNSQEDYWQYIECNNATRMQ